MDDARRTENDAARTLIDFVKGLVEKSPFTISSTAAGTVGAFAGLGVVASIGVGTTVDALWE